MHRFFLTDFRPSVDEVVSLLPIHNQLHRVLRAQPGDRLILLDNTGHERLVEVESVGRRDTTARVVEVRAAPAEAATPVTLYQCVLKADKFEIVLQKATELGVATFVPVVSNRTVNRTVNRAVARLDRVLVGKPARWEAIVREAAEQSGRGALPVVAPAMSFADAVTHATGTKLLPWEEGQANPGLLAALGQAQQPVEAVNVLIGPEGGLEASEVTAAQDAGWQVVSMGRRILRAETAAIAALALVSAAMGELGDEPVTKRAVPEDSAREFSQRIQPENLAREFK